MGKPLSIVVAFVLALSVAACGSYGWLGRRAGRQRRLAVDSEPSSFPVDGRRGRTAQVTIDERPERIVSLSPTATEDLFAIGAGEQVIAVDDQSNFPPDGPTTELSGFEPNVEAIAGYEPDLVVFATEPGDLGSSLEGLGITALQLDAAPTLEVAYEQIEQLGLGDRSRGRGAGARRRHALGDRGARGRRRSGVAGRASTTSSTTRSTRSRRRRSSAAVRAARPREHRRRGRQGERRVPAAVRRVHHRRPTPT